MDQIMVDVTDIPEAGMGVRWCSGDQGGDRITPDEGALGRYHSL